jgi:hypothetical protein
MKMPMLQIAYVDDTAIFDRAKTGRSEEGQGRCRINGILFNAEELQFETG